MNHLVKRVPVRVSSLRALGGTANVFAIESFMDELAAAAGADPLEFRLRHLKDPRARAVLEAVAASAGWRSGRRATARAAAASALRATRTAPSMSRKSRKSRSARSSR